MRNENGKIGETVLIFEYPDGVKRIHPAHPLVRAWAFTEETMDDAYLAHYMACIAEKTGITATQLSHLFPAVLRMLKRENEWTK